MYMQDGFVYLDEVVPNVRWDAKYYGDDNFTGARVDGYEVNRVVGSRELSDALIKAARLAEEQGLGLLLWDAYRPKRAIRCFFEWVQRPEDGRTKLKYYPKLDKTQLIPLDYVSERSRHSRGGAVDLTLYRLDDGEELDMFGHFDLMDDSSHHGAQGVPKEAAKNRELLCSLMRSCGFFPYVGEWWHYNLKNEPYPDTYFDFPIR